MQSVNDCEIEAMNQTLLRAGVNYFLLILLATLPLVSCDSAVVPDPARHRLNVMALDLATIGPISDKPVFSDSDVQITTGQYFEALKDGINKRNAGSLVDILSSSVDLDQESTVQILEKVKSFLKTYPGTIKGGQYKGYDYLGDLDKFWVIRVTYELDFSEEASDTGKIKLYFLVGDGVHSFRGFQFGA